MLPQNDLSPLGIHHSPLNNTLTPFQDVVTTRRALESYANADNSFPTTREYKFLLSIIDAFDAGDSELFVGAVQEFDRLTKLVSLFSRPVHCSSPSFSCW